MKVKLLSCVGLFTSSWTVAYQVPMSMGFSRQEYWSGLPFLSPGHLPNLRIELWPPALQADALPFEPPRKPPEDEPQTNGSYKFRQIIFKMVYTHRHIHP